MRRVYLAGPMQGLPRYNFDEFLRVGAMLVEAGYVVFNPAEIDLKCGVNPDLPLHDPGQPEDWSVEKALENDIYAVLESDGIVLLPGWRKSKGACLERMVAQFTGREVWEFCEDPRETRGWGLRRLNTHYRPLAVFDRD